MSYEGYIEYITSDGIYYVNDCNDDSSPPKPYWMHSVDQTNGIEHDNPRTFRSQKRSIKEVEHKKVDHRGNVYYTLSDLWEPVGKEWRKIT